METLGRNISRCFPFTRWGINPSGSLLCLKKTLEGAESVAEGTPVRARERPGSGGMARAAPGAAATFPGTASLPPGFTVPFSPPGPRADPAPCERSPCLVRTVPGAGPGRAPAVQPPAARVAPATCALTAARAADGASRPPGTPPAVPGRGCPSARCPAPSRGAPGAPARGCPSAALTSAPRRESPRHLAHSMPAEDGRTGRRRLPAVPKAGHAGGVRGWRRGGAATRQR